jgi:aryl-alcohol dehydrogenase-like predicted oxidoreductase
VIPEQFDLAPDLRICRILNGMWQVSGGHGRIDRERALTSMSAHVDDGYTTWDLADHYGPAEDLVGEFRRRRSAARGAAALGDLQFFTKWVPRPGPVPQTTVRNAVATSQRRMATDRLDLLQFHWWDYGDLRYFDALARLADLREAGAIRHLALTNFDTERLAAILERGIGIVSNQVQFSVIDRRPEMRMAPVCRRGGVHLLAYERCAAGCCPSGTSGNPNRAAPRSIRSAFRNTSEWWTPGATGTCSRNCFGLCRPSPGGTA